VEPADIPPLTRHLDAHYAAITLTDRIWHPYSLGRERILRRGRDDRDRARISKEQLAREPSLFSIVNSNSPLRLDHAYAAGLMAMAEHGQPVVLTPFHAVGAHWRP